MKIPKPSKPITAVKKTSRPGSTKKPTGAPSGPAAKPPTKPGTFPKQMTKPSTPAAKKQKEDQLRMTPKKIK